MADKKLFPLGNRRCDGIAQRLDKIEATLQIIRKKLRKLLLQQVSPEQLLKLARAVAEQKATSDTLTKTIEENK